MKFKILTAFITCFLLSACGHQQTYGDKMMNLSDQSKELADQWNSSEKLMIKGKANEEEGRKLVAKGEKLISKGNALIAEGRSQMKEANVTKLKSEEIFQNKLQKKT